MSVPFWKKESGNLLNAKTGLTEDQIKFLQSLKVGDRLILWTETQKKSQNHPDFRLKFYEKREVYE